MNNFAIFVTIIAAALFGISTPVSKIFLQKFNPFQLAGLLYLGAGFILFPFAVFSRKKYIIPKLNRTNISRIILMIIFGGILGPVFLLSGLKLASASSVSLWLNLELFATAVLGYLFFKDHIGKYEWIGIACGIFAGFLLVINEKVSGISAGLLITIACFCWGLDNHFTALIDGITPVQSTVLKGIFAGLVNFIIGYFLTGEIPSIQLVIMAVILGAVSYGISIVLYITAAQNIGAVRSQIIFSSAPFFGLIFSAVLLYETISGIQLAAAFLLIISIIFMFIEKHVHSHAHERLVHIHLHGHDDMHHAHEHDPGSSKHVHPHEHEEISHSHTHLPDLHHRHDH